MIGGLGDARTKAHVATQLHLHDHHSSRPQPLHGMLTPTSTARKAMQSALPRRTNTPGTVATAANASACRYAAATPSSTIPATNPNMPPITSLASRCRRGRRIEATTQPANTGRLSASADRFSAARGILARSCICYAYVDAGRSQGGRSHSARCPAQPACNLHDGESHPERRASRTRQGGRPTERSAPWSARRVLHDRRQS